MQKQPSPQPIALEDLEEVKGGYYHYGSSAKKKAPRGKGAGRSGN